MLFRSQVTLRVFIAIDADADPTTMVKMQFGAIMYGMGMIHACINFQFDFNHIVLYVIWKLFCHIIQYEFSDLWLRHRVRF